MPAIIIVWWMTHSMVQYTLAGFILGVVVDGASLKVKSELEESVEFVWEKLLSKQTFIDITRGMVAYIDATEWPTTIFRDGETLRTRIRVFGIGPAISHEVYVSEVDDHDRIITTEESGGLIRSLRHRMTLAPLSESNCYYVDLVEINAGVLTPVIWLFAKFFYRHRHRKWKMLLRTSKSSQD